MDITIKGDCKMLIEREEKGRHSGYEKRVENLKEMIEDVERIEKIEKGESLV